MDWLVLLTKEVSRMKTITYEEFVRVDIRSATIIRAEEFPKAKKPAFKIWADFGEEIGILQTSAQVTINYSIDSLLGRRVMGCINLGEKNIAGFVSQFLLLGFTDQNGAVCLADISPLVLNGQKMH